MSKTPNFDSKIKPILDALVPGEQMSRISGETWEMTEREIDVYKRFNVPPGTLSPMDKRRRLATFSTGFQFWWNKHFESGEPVLSFHHPGSGVRVLTDAEWFDSDYSDTHLEFDSSRPFFEMMRELQVQVPYPATSSIDASENSIALLSFGDVNSYFMLGCRSKNSFFSSLLLDSENSSLVTLGTNLQDCHYIGLCHNMHNCRYAFHSQGSMNSAFINDCRDCRNVFGGTGLRNREYVFFNEQLSKEEYEKRIAEIDLGKRSVVNEYMKKFDEMVESDMMWPENFNVNSSGSTGDYMTGAVDCLEHFYSLPGARDNFASAWTFGGCENTHFLWGGIDGSDQVEVVTAARAQDLKYSLRCQDSRSLEYCLLCLNCENCFGCVGLNRKKFCIFNKQYSEEEYWQKVDELKCAMLDRGEYGEFFPSTLATSYQPEGGCIEYCNMTYEEVKAFGLNEFDLNADNAAGMDGLDVSTMARAEDVPDSIDDLTDEWIGKPIYDPESKRKFGFLKPEVEHYRKLRIAPPVKHFVPRSNVVTQSINSCILGEANCEKTGKAITISLNRRWKNRKFLCMEEYLKYIEERN